MNKLFAICFCLLLFACEPNKKAPFVEKSDTSFVADFLERPSTIASLEKENAILHFAKEAKVLADESFSLTKDNAEKLFEKAKNYTNSVIVVEDHTIVSITDFDDCTASGSWGACMPFGKGYIKKGSLEKQKDYINNIIGVPDTQKRTLYLFNLK